ncbi:hypothetical protein GI364_02725 [Alicyclobacillus sp. SO9]|nr:hypothetical protein GI364_02725 [Alicyclobacillus sp. SO9]
MRRTVAGLESLVSNRRKPEGSRKEAGRKPEGNQKETRRKPEGNQKETRRKPEGNQKETRRKPEGSRAALHVMELSIHNRFLIVWNSLRTLRTRH